MTAGWHILRKDPEDLPPFGEWVLIVLKEKEEGAASLPKIGSYYGRKTSSTNKEGWIIANCTNGAISDENYIYYTEMCEVAAWRDLPDMPKELQAEMNPEPTPRKRR